MISHIGTGTVSVDFLKISCCGFFESMRDMPAVDIQSITNYETAKNLLCFEVVGTEQNADMLANIPHTDMENMSMVYRLQLDSNAQGTSTILITNAMMEQYGITKDQLHVNTPVRSTPKFLVERSARPSTVSTKALCWSW